MRVFLVGNPLVEVDALPHKLAPLLKQILPDIVFEEFDPSENLPPDDPLVLVDTVIDAKDIAVYTDIDAFASHKALSLHDFDLGFTLKLAKKLGKLNRLVIVGVPPGLSLKPAARAVAEQIQGLR